MGNEFLPRPIAEVQRSNSGAGIGKPCQLPSGGLRYTPDKDHKLAAEVCLKSARQKDDCVAVAWLTHSPRIPAHQQLLPFFHGEYFMQRQNLMGMLRLVAVLAAT